MANGYAEVLQVMPGRIAPHTRTRTALHTRIPSAAHCALRRTRQTPGRPGRPVPACPSKSSSVLAPVVGNVPNPFFVHSVPTVSVLQVHNHPVCLLFSGGPWIGSRSAVGMGSLPMNIPFEAEALFEVHDLSKL